MVRTVQDVNIIGREGQTRNSDLEVRVGLDCPDSANLVVSVKEIVSYSSDFINIK